MIAPGATSAPRFRRALAAGVMLCASAAHAGEAVVRVPKTVVRSAPFEAAPEIARLHAGDRLPADDRPQGAWRRVRLPDGRFGLVHDADVEVAEGPPPPPPEPYAPPVPPAPPVPFAPPVPATPPLRPLYVPRAAEAIVVVVPASGRGVSAPIVQYVRELLAIELSHRLRARVITYDSRPVAIQIDPRALSGFAASIGGGLAVALDVSREAGVTTLDVTGYDTATAARWFHARQSTAAGPEVLPDLTRAVTAHALLQDVHVGAGHATRAKLPPHTLRLGVRALVMVPVVTAAREAQALGGFGLTATINIKDIFADLLADFGSGGARYTVGVGAGLHARLSDGADAPFVGGSLHWMDQHLGGRSGSGMQLRPTVGYVWGRNEIAQCRVDLSYFIDLFEERTRDRLIAGYDATYHSHGPMLALGAAF